MSRSCALLPRKSTKIINHCLGPLSLLPYLVLSSFLSSFLASSAIHWGPTVVQALDVVCHSALSLGRFDSLLEMLSSLPFGTPVSPATAMAALLGPGTGGQMDRDRWTNGLGQVDEWIGTGGQMDRDGSVRVPLVRGRDC